MTLKTLITCLLVSLLSPALHAQIVYQGESGVGKGKHLVFIASDHEYRSEQTLPALARILAKHHGFKCTVVFGVDKDGCIEGGSSNVPGLEALATADGVVIFARFINLPEEQMKHIIGYVEKGGPLVGFRTSSHAFKIPENAPNEKYSFDSKADGFAGGFGQKYLGNTWEGHYGRNHSQGSRIKLIPEKKDHAILRGVNDNAFTYAGGYTSVIRPGMVPLTMVQPLLKLDPKSEPHPKKPAVVSSWTFSYPSKDGKSHRVFHTTQGASEDILDDNYRRLAVNAILWSVGLEDSIKSDINIAFVGPYNPTIYNFGQWVKNQKPEDLAGFTSPIGAKAPADRTLRKRKRKKK